MDELVVAPVNTTVPARQNTLFNNRFLIVIPIFFALNGVFKTSSFNTKSIGDIFSKLPNMLNLENLGEKIEMLKKIGPYLPETIVGPTNTIILTLDRVNKIRGLMDAVSVNRTQQPILAVKELSNKERLNHIITTLSEELPEDKTKNIKPLLDIALNIDKYKGLIEMISSLNSTSSNSEKENSKTTLNNDASQSKQSGQGSNMQLDNMINAIKPMLGENADKGMDKIKDMMQMFEILNVLNAPDKEKTSE